MVIKCYISIPCLRTGDKGAPPSVPEVLVYLPSKGIAVTVPADLFDCARVGSTEVQTFQHPPYDLLDPNQSYEVLTTTEGDRSSDEAIEMLAAESWLPRDYIERVQHLGWTPPGPITAFVVHQRFTSDAARGNFIDQRLLREDIGNTLRSSAGGSAPPMRGGLLGADSGITRRIWAFDKAPDPPSSSPTSEGEEGICLHSPADDEAQESATGEPVGTGTGGPLHMSGEEDEGPEPRICAGIEEDARLTAQAAAALRDKAYARELYDSERYGGKPPPLTGKDGTLADFLAHTKDEIARREYGARLSPQRARTRRSHISSLRARRTPRPNSQKGLPRSPINFRQKFPHLRLLALHANLAPPHADPSRRLLRRSHPTLQFLGETPWAQLKLAGTRPLPT